MINGFNTFNFGITAIDCDNILIFLSCDYKKAVCCENTKLSRFYQHFSNNVFHSENGILPNYPQFFDQPLFGNHPNLV